MTQTLFSTAEQALLAPTGLDQYYLDQVIGRLTNIKDSDFADMYFQYSKHESWSLDEGKVKSGSFNIDQGVGLRSVSGEKTAFAYSENLDPKAILAATDVVKALGEAGQNKSEKLTWSQPTTSALYRDLDPIAAMSDATKIAILEQVDTVARSHDSRVKEVMASLSAVYEIVLIVTSDGRQIPDVRPLVRVALHWITLIQIRLLFILTKQYAKLW